MKEIKQKNLLICAGILTILLIIAGICFGYEDIVKASFEEETNIPEVWTDLNIEYRESMDMPMAIVTVTFHNNKVFETTDDWNPDDIYYATYNFTSFDFRLRSAEETDAYSAGLEALSKNGVDLPFGESYEMDFRVMELVAGEPINMEFTAHGYEEDDRRTTIEEKLAFTLEPPASAPTPEPTPGFEAVFAIAG